MVPVGEDFSAPPEHAIDCPRRANRKRLDSPRQRHRIRRLDNQVEVIALHREVYDAKPIPLPHCSNRAEHDAKALPRPQPRRLVAHPRRDVHGIPRCQLRPPHMRHSSIRLLRPPRSRPIPTAPSITKLKPELLLPLSHIDFSINHPPDIDNERAQAQIEGFLSTLDETRSDSIACRRGMSSACPMTPRPARSIRALSSTG